MGQAIAAISTPLGEGGIGIVRISGSDAKEIADKVFKSVSRRTVVDARGYTALFGTVYSGAKPIDEAVALVFTAPHSYTGEDVVELSVHGGVYIVRKLLRAVFEAGALPAGPGEFTRRAFENGKMNLAEAESVMALISAAGEQEHKTALETKQGRVSGEIEKIKAELLAVDAAMSVFADYPDEDLPEADAGNVKSKLSAVRERLWLLMENFDAGRLIREGVATAIIGAPNVGKSTLMNMLSGTERSIVTSVAGTTRDVIEETVRVGDVLLRLADTAGVHTSEDEVESIGVGLAFERAEQAQLVLAVFDGSKSLDEDDRRIIDLIKDKRTVVIINKSDKPQMVDERDFAEFSVVKISAKEKSGEKELTLAISEISGAARLNPDVAVLSTERQRSCVARAYDSVCEAINTMENGYTLDAVGICADEALSALLELTGERVTNAVADEVFSRFCVGK